MEVRKAFHVQQQLMLPASHLCPPPFLAHEHFGCRRSGRRLWWQSGAASAANLQIRTRSGCNMAGAQLLRSPTLPSCTCLQLAARHPAQLRQPCTARLGTWPAPNGSSSSTCSLARRSHTLRVAALEEAPAEASADLRVGSDPSSLSADGVFADVRPLLICQRSGATHAASAASIQRCWCR